jgi:hypothetical protein
MSEPTVYLCENPACSLGAVGEPGHFTGGITAEQVHLVTGRPVDGIKDHGEGYCPNCGKKGRKAPKES